MSESNQGTHTGGGGGAASSSPANSSFRSPYQGGLRGGRGHGRGGSRRSGAPSSTSATSSSTGKTFEGRIADLEKFVYEHVTPSQAAESFRTTTNELAQHIAATYKSGTDVADVMLQRKMVKIPESANLRAEHKKSDTEEDVLPTRGADVSAR